MDWMEKFHCIGGECPMTCCCGSWKIKLSDEEISKYENMDHPFKNNILMAIDKEKKCMKEKNGNCQMLTENGWCQIVQNCGDEYLSKTCKYFPRQIKQYGDVQEQTVGIACPVVAAYLLEQHPIEFCFDEVEVSKDIIQETDYEVYDALAVSRTYLVELLQSYENDFSTGKMYIILSVLYKIRELIVNENLKQWSIKKSLESYEEDEVKKLIFDKGEEISQNYMAKSSIIRKMLYQIEPIFDVIHSKKFFYDECFCEDIKTWMDKKESLEKCIKDYTKYFRENYLQLFQNYFVYQLFGEWIEMDTEKFGNVFISKIIEFNLIQLWAMSVWKNKGYIEKKEYQNIIASCDRAITHNMILKKGMNEFLQQNEMNNSANLLLLLIV